MSDLNQEEDEDFSINPDDIIKVIDLDDDNLSAEGAAELQDEDFDGDDDLDDNDDEMETDEASAGPVQDDSKLSFTGHKDNSVICARVSPVNSSLVVTGGQDDQGLVWNSKDGSVYFQCTGHSDTVVGVGFSHDGSMVATADMKGLIKVWAVDSGSEIWSFEVSEIEWIQWHQAAPVLLAATKEGQVWMWKVPSGDCKTFVGYGPSAICGKILPDGKRACIGYEDGVVKVWDLKSTEAVFTISGHEGHKDPVFSIDHNADGSLVMTGSGDVTAKLISTVNGKVVHTLQCQRSATEEEDSVECVGFCKTHDFLATGTLSGSLEIWDLPTRTVRNRCSHPYGIVKLQWSAITPTLYTACLDGNIRQFDALTGQLINTWQGHAAAILDFDIARDESLILSASDDFTAKVFSLQGGQR